VPPPRVITETFAELQTRFAAHGAADGPDIPIRLAVIGDLDVLQDPQAIPFLEKVALKDPHWDVSEAAVKALARYDNPAAVPALLAILSDFRSYLKVSAAEGLGHLAMGNALPTLLKGMQDSDSQVRVACIAAVTKICLAQTVVDATTTLPALLDALNDTDGTVRAAAALTLGTLSGKDGPDRNRVITALVKATTDINPLVVSAAKASLKSFGQTPEK
jgi:HEAT repeat protein